MHEWALAESVIETVIKEAEKEGLTKITDVAVKIGELQNIELDIFKQALDDMAEFCKPPVKIEKISADLDKSIMKCRICSNEWDFGDSSRALRENEAEAIHFIPEISHIYIRCPRCGSPDFEILHGRGVRIEYIEGEK